MTKFNFSFLRLLEGFISIFIYLFTIAFSLMIVIIWQDVPNLKMENIYINAISTLIAIIILVWLKDSILNDLIKIEKRQKKGGKNV